MGWEGTDPVEWARETKARMTAVYRGSIEELARDMAQTRPNGGRVPVVTGNLYRSLMMSTTAPPPRADSDATFSAPPTFSFPEINADSIVYLGFQANYAHRQNYGFVGTDSLGRTYNQAGAGFAEASAANWPSIVDAEAAYVRNNVMSRKG